MSYFCFSWMWIGLRHFWLLSHCKPFSSEIHLHLMCFFTWYRENSKWNVVLIPWTLSVDFEKRRVVQLNVPFISLNKINGMQNSTQNLVTFTHEKFSRYALKTSSHVMIQKLHKVEWAQCDDQWRAPTTPTMNLLWAGIWTCVQSRVLSSGVLAVKI